MCIYTAVDFDVKFEVCQGATCAVHGNTCEYVMAYVKTSHGALWMSHTSEV